MKRLADRGCLIRISKGIYGTIRETPFGKIKSSQEEILSKMLLREGGETIGYLAGPTLLNRLGLCSWIPRQCHIASNRYRQRIPEDVAICLQKPLIPVNSNNAPYLQTLEAICAMERYPVDVNAPDEILRSIMRVAEIDAGRLVWMARNHVNQALLLKTIDYALKQD